MSKIMITDDDENLVNFISIHLKDAGYDITAATDGRDALRKMENETVNLAVVDVMMPFMDGLSLTKEIRRIYDIPVILLTAKGEINDKEDGFNAGTDDYMVKPFEPRELLFRIEALLRRYEKQGQNNTKRIGNIQINPSNYSVKIEDRTFMLPLKEFELLYLLASHPGQTFSREQVIEKIWGLDYTGDTRTVDVHIKRVRERFSRVTDRFSIKTVRGAGYFLEVTD